MPTVTRKTAKTGDGISLLGFGLMRLPCLDEQKFEIDYPTSEKMIARAFEGGVNYFDTAWPYHGGNSELFAGHALSAYPRDSWHIASKMPTWFTDMTPDGMRETFEKQLEKCRVEYFDYYLMHNLNRANYENAKSLGMYEYLRGRQKAGQIRHLGFSFHDNLSTLKRVVAEQEWDFAQLQINYLDWLDIGAESMYGVVNQAGIPVVVMEPLRGGTLANLPTPVEAILKEADPGVSAASWGVRFAASLPGVMTVLSGMSSPDQMEDNLRTMSPFTPLSEEEKGLLLGKVADAYRKSGAIPCTGCRYCVPCPFGVEIPRAFAIYNHYRANSNKLYFANNFRTFEGSQHPEHCTACGECVSKCPQGIDIPARLSDVLDELKKV